MSEVKIQKIVLQIGDQEVALTVEELEKLRDTLNDLYQEKIRYIPDPIPTYPAPVYPRPEPIDDWGRPWWEHPTVTWLDSTNTFKITVK